MKELKIKDEELSLLVDIVCISRELDIAGGGDYYDDDLDMKEKLKQYKILKNFFKRNGIKTNY